MPEASFKKLVVWQKAIKFIAGTYRMTANLPREELYGLTTQLRRASVSIAANVAEGHGRSTRGEYLNHVSIAIGSLNEVDALIAVCLELGMLPASTVKAAQEKVDELQRMLRRLRQSLRAAR